MDISQGIIFIRLNDMGTHSNGVQYHLFGFGLDCIKEIA